MPILASITPIKLDLLNSKIKAIPATVGGINIGNWIKLVNDCKKSDLALDNKYANGVPNITVMNRETTEVDRVNFIDSNTIASFTCDKEELKIA
jgi:hypothetical protein